ncbi:hypothetical protein P43SY_002855 [Pythium insidiosum]|uniref:Uncharacterized protein n=1 Tax=Pythium insidiosum TaxID=114742 RepID=A0AAD5QAG4_PYTIN|nr:hypothetical protein P43SY_002855 [Pythium insidiosum]
MSTLADEGDRDARASATSEKEAQARRAETPEATEVDVWSSFEESVAYMRRLAELYDEAFVAPRAAAKRSAVPTVASIDAAKQHAREGIELLATNLLNVSSAIVEGLDHQVREPDRRQTKGL